MPVTTAGHEQGWTQRCSSGQGTQGHPGDPKLRHSRVQGREELEEHSWGRSMCHLAPATLLVGNESALSASYFKTRNEKFSESSEKN